MLFVFGKRSEQILSTVEELPQKIARRALQITKIDFGFPLTGGRRTKEEQNKLFFSGDSGIDGINSMSYHQKGWALDVYAYVEDSASYDPYFLTHIAAAFFQASGEYGVRMTWGGFWKKPDMPHMQFELGCTKEKV